MEDLNRIKPYYVYIAKKFIHRRQGLSWGAGVSLTTPLFQFLLTFGFLCPLLSKIIDINTIWYTYMPTQLITAIIISRIDLNDLIRALD